MPEESEEWNEILKDFLIESSEIVESLPVDILALENNPRDESALNKLFRSFHTVKGAAGFLGFVNIARFTHKLEDLLNKLRKFEMSVDSSVIDILLEASDLLKTIVEKIKEFKSDAVEVDPCLKKVDNLMAASSSQIGTDVKKEQESPKPLSKQEEEPAEPIRTKEVKRQEKTDKNEEMIKEAVPLKSPSPEAETVKMPFVSAEPSAQKESKSVSEEAASLPDDKKISREFQQEQTIRVDVQRLDNLMNYVGELVLCRNRLIQLHRKMQEQEILPESINSAMSDAIHQIAFNAAELQNGVMKTRMLPISKVFSKFQRLMRELEKQTGKEVRFQISGEETELDKTIIEEIGDPLIHLLRNAMDHGLESPDERVTKGKTRYGHIHLSASHQGNQIIIEIQDDGRGISVEKIRDKAIRQGLITSEKARQMSKRDILDLIFLPGFSTADRVTDLSGRGVGMDVVKNKVSQLKGIIEISTELNEGSSIKLKLPLTLAIIQVLLISVSEHVFALPLTSVVESIRISSKDISYIDGKPVMEFRGRAVPLLSLKEIYNLEEKNAPVSSGQKNEAMLENLDEKNNWVYIVIVGLAEMLRGIMVDYLIEQEEIVIKSLTHFLSGVQGFSGCTIMGDGRLSLIIDIDHLIKN